MEDEAVLVIPDLWSGGFPPLCLLALGLPVSDWSTLIGRAPTLLRSGRELP